MEKAGWVELKSQNEDFANRGKKNRARDGRSIKRPWTSNPYFTGCPRRNVPDFGRVFLMIKYTDITQNTYIQS